MTGIIDVSFICLLANTLDLAVAAQPSAAFSLGDVVTLLVLALGHAR